MKNIKMYFHNVAMNTRGMMCDPSFRELLLEELIDVVRCGQLSKINTGQGVSRNMVYDGDYEVNIVRIDESVCFTAHPIIGEAQCVGDENDVYTDIVSGKMTIHKNEWCELENILKNSVETSRIFDQDNKDYLVLSCGKSDFGWEVKVAARPRETFSERGDLVVWSVVCEDEVRATIEFQKILSLLSLLYMELK